jgi:hypothetical protein
MTLRPRGREAMLAGAAIAAYIIAVRPWHLRWSATPEEVTRALPGDQLVAQPVTRPPMRSPSVPRPSTSGRSRSSWARTAWVVQLPVAGEPGRLQAAQHRPDRPQAAAAGGGRPGPARPRPYPGHHGLVHPAHQALVLRTAAPHSDRAVERATSPPAPGLEPGRSSWIQRDDQTTLLIVRLRNQWRPSPGNFLIGRVVTEPAHLCWSTRRSRPGPSRWVATMGPRHHGRPALVGAANNRDPGMERAALR